MSNIPQNLPQNTVTSLGYSWVNFSFQNLPWKIITDYACVVMFVKKKKAYSKVLFLKELFYPSNHNPPKRNHLCVVILMRPLSELWPEREETDFLGLGRWRSG